nr:unnamed protein product [Callosobruchus analis]
MTTVLQINLHHSKAATATLCQKILADDIGVVLLQEPWTVKGRMMGMSTAKSKLIYDTQCDKPIACTFLNNKIKALKITDLCSRDTAVTEVHLQTGDGSIRILFASVYLPYDYVEAPPDHSDEEDCRIRSEQGEAPHTGAGC